MLTGLWPCCANSDTQTPFPSWGSSGRQAQKDLFLLSQSCTNPFSPPSVLSIASSLRLYQTLVSCRAVFSPGNAPTPAQLLRMLLLGNCILTFWPLLAQKTSSRKHHLARHLSASPQQQHSPVTGRGLATKAQTKLNLEKAADTAHPTLSHQLQELGRARFSTPGVTPQAGHISPLIHGTVNYCCSSFPWQCGCV